MSWWEVVEFESGSEKELAADDPFIDKDGEKTNEGDIERGVQGELVVSSAWGGSTACAGLCSRSTSRGGIRKPIPGRAQICSTLYRRWS